MRMTDADRGVEATADRQHGAFSRGQAFTLGASRRLMDRRLADGTWVRVAPSVYVLARSAGTWHRQCKAAELAAKGSAIAGPAAAALHELTGFRPGPIELVVPPDASTRHALARCHRYVGARTTTVANIAVTTVAQTLVDLTSRVLLWRLEQALDDALLTKRLAIDDLVERATFYEGTRRPGSPLLRAMVAERTNEGWTPPESSLESALWAVLLSLAGQFRMLRQAPVPWGPEGGGRVDVLLPDHGVVIEADGRRWHARVEAFDRDRWRDNEAAASGLAVLRFTFLHLTLAPRDVADLIERTVAARQVAA